MMMQFLKFHYLFYIDKLVLFIKRLMPFNFFLCRVISIFHLNNISLFKYEFTSLILTMPLPLNILQFHSYTFLFLSAFSCHLFVVKSLLSLLALSSSLLLKLLFLELVTVVHASFHVDVCTNLCKWCTVV